MKKLIILAVALSALSLNANAEGSSSNLGFVVKDSACQYVKGYYRRDGTYVNGYYRGCNGQ